MARPRSCSCSRFQSLIRPTFWLALALGLGTHAAPSLSDTWRFGYPVAVGAGYNDNVNLSVDDPQASAKLSLVPRVLAKRETERSTFDLDLAVRFEFYSNSDAAQDRDDPSLTAAYQYEFERSSVGLAGSASRQSTRVSEFEDTGRVNLDASRDELGLDAFWHYQLDDLTLIITEGTVRDVSYTTDQLTNFSSHGANVQVLREVSPRLGVFGGLDALFFNPEGEDTVNSESYALRAGGAYQISENLGVTLSIGEFLVQRQGLGSENDWLGRIELNYAGYRTRFRAGAERSVDPSSAGQLRTRDTVQLGLNRDLTERHSVGVSARWLNSQSVSAEGSIQGFELEPWISWQAAQSIEVRGTYTFRSQDRSGEPETAESNAFLVEMRYSPQI